MNWSCYGWNDHSNANSFVMSRNYVYTDIFILKAHEGGKIVTVTYHLYAIHVVLQMTDPLIVSDKTHLCVYPLPDDKLCFNSLLLAQSKAKLCSVP